MDGCAPIVWKHAPERNFPFLGQTRYCVPYENSGLFRWTDSLTTVTQFPSSALPQHHHVPFFPIYMLNLHSFPLFYVHMPTLPIYFNLPCDSFTLLTHRTCFPVFLLFSPQLHISLLHYGFVLPNIIYFFATSLHSSLRFHAIPTIYFSPAYALSLPRAPHFSTQFITSSATFIPLPSHTHHRSRFFPFSFHCNLPSPQSHWTGIPIPITYNAVSIKFKADHLQFAWRVEITGKKEEPNSSYACVSF